MIINGISLTNPYAPLFAHACEGLESVTLVSGPAASGKSFRGKLAEESARCEGLRYIDMSEVIKSHLKLRTRLGLVFELHMAEQAAGKMQPDIETTEAFCAEIAGLKAEGMRRLVAIGWPRTKMQKDVVLDSRVPVRSLILTPKNSTDLIANLAARAELGRVDDANPVVVSERANFFQTETLPAFREIEKCIGKENTFWLQSGHDTLLRDIKALLALAFGRSHRMWNHFMANMRDPNHPAGKRILDAMAAA